MPKSNPLTLACKAAFVRSEYLMTGVIDEIEKEIEVIKAKNPNNNFIQKKDNQIGRIVQYSTAAEELIKTLEHLIRLQTFEIQHLKELFNQEMKANHGHVDELVATLQHFKKSA